jgi:hypothetical protein
MSNVKTANSIPEAIDTFIKKNFSKLNDILMKGLEENNNEGCLYIEYKESEEKVDVSFLNKENIQKITTLDTWKDIREKYKGNIYIISEIDNKRIFIVNI